MLQSSCGFQIGNCARSLEAGVLTYQRRPAAPLRETAPSSTLSSVMNYIQMLLDSEKGSVTVLSTLNIRGENSEDFEGSTDTVFFP